MSQLASRRNNGFSLLEVSFIFLAILSQVTSFLTTGVIPTRQQCHHQTSLNGRGTDFEEDYYAALNLSRSATPDEIRSAFRKLARTLHPDRFVEEFKFNPPSMSTSEVRAFLTEQRISFVGVFERAELNRLASEAQKKNGAIPSALQKRREDATDRFALINLAYTTLYDTNSRIFYDLSGDWGLGQKQASSRSRATGNNNGARQQQERAGYKQREAAQQRQRRQQEEAQRATRQQQEQRNVATRRKWEQEATQRKNVQRQQKRWEQEGVPEARRQQERVEAFQRTADQRKKRLQEEALFEEQRAQARVEAIQRNAAREREERERAEAAKRTVAQQQDYELNLKVQAEKKVRETKLKKEKNKEIKRVSEERRRERESQTRARKGQVDPWKQDVNRVKEFLSKSIFGSLWD